MTPFRRVLIPVDGSDVCAWVVHRSRRILEMPGVSVTLLQVVSDPADYDRLHAIQHQLEREGITARAVVRFGEPVAQIVREIPSHDLVILATHVARRPEPAMFGGVALGVLHASPVPVLLHRPTWPLPEEPVEFQRLVLPLDGSALAERILPTIETFCVANDSQLLLLSASHPENRDRARAYLSSVARRLPGSVRTSIEAGSAVPAILAAASRWAADSIALTTHGRSGLSRLLYGSVTERLLHETTVPVFVLNSRRSRSTLPAELAELT